MSSKCILMVLGLLRFCLNQLLILMTVTTFTQIEAVNQNRGTRIREKHASLQIATLKSPQHRLPRPCQHLIQNLLLLPLVQLVKPILPH